MGKKVVTTTPAQYVQDYDEPYPHRQRASDFWGEKKPSSLPIHTMVPLVAFPEEIVSKHMRDCCLEVCVCVVTIRCVPFFQTSAS
jgi:hypothetical protein